MIAGGWQPDPTGRHENRWWDGRGWTDQVADGGVTSVDDAHRGVDSGPDAADDQPDGQHRRRTAAIVAGVAAVLIVLVAVVIFVASDDDSTDGRASSTGGNDSGCALVTTAEVAAAVGLEFTDGEPIEELGTPGCIWESTAPPSEDVSGPLNVEIFVFPLTGEDRQSFEELEGQGANEAIDLGDQAVLRCSIEDDIGPGCDAYGGLFVAQGSRYVAVDLGNYTWPGDLSQDEVRQALLDIGAAAAGRLE